MSKRISLIVIIQFNLICALAAHGSTRVANSCSQSDVQAAINTALNGDTVVIPPGTCIWTSAISLAKSLTINGNGIDGTIIRSHGFRINAGLNDWRITGFTFDSQWVDMYLIAFAQDRAGSKRFRIDHCKFMNEPYSTGGTLLFHGYSYGVVDHCIFRDCLNEILSFGGDGNPSYSRTPVLGGYENGTIFVEDSQFILTSAVYDKYGDTHYAAENLFDGNSGPRIVFRHNSIADHKYCRWLSAIETHGFESEFSTVGDARAVNAVEIYDNLFTSNYPGSASLIKLRGIGGGGVIFNNTVTGSGSSFQGIELKNLRSEKADYSGSLSKGNINAAGYTQFCHSRQADEAGLVCENCTTQTGSCRDQIQNLYIWGNVNIGAVSVNDVDYIPDDIIFNTHYFMSSMPGYTPYPYPHPITNALDSPPNLRIIP